MKKKWSILPALAVALTMVLSGCADSFDVQKEGVPEVDIRADIQDVSDENSQREYKFTAASTDTYTFTAEEAAKVQIFDSNGKQLCLRGGRRVAVPDRRRGVFHESDNQSSRRSLHREREGGGG